MNCVIVCVCVCACIGMMYAPACRVLFILFRAYVTLLDSDVDSDDSISPTPPVPSPLTPEIGRYVIVDNKTKHIQRPELMPRAH